MFYRILTLISSLLLAGCSILSPVQTPPTHTYTLNNIEDYYHHKSYSDRSILVAVPTTGPTYQTSKMLYSTGPYKLSSFARNRWIAPPSQMIAPILAKSVSNTGYYHAVVLPPFIGNTDVRLETQLLKFQQEFSEYDSRFKIVMHAQVIDNTSNEVIKERYFEATAPAPYENPYGGVIAANAATRHITQEIARFSIMH
jgi:cholesterol transport system auxiliary component